MSLASEHSLKRKKQT